MPKIKVNYSSGRYKLVKEVQVRKFLDCLPNQSPYEEIEERIYLTKTQAKALMKDGLYNRLGFKSIKLEERID